MENKAQKKKEIEIDIIPILKALLGKLWLIILVGAVVAGIAFGATKMLIKPTYRCGFTAYVNNQLAQADKTTLTNSDIAASQQLTKTLSYIIRSNTILSASLESIDSELSYTEFTKMVSTEIKDGTELISVFVVNQDPQKAYDLANAIAKTAPSYMAQIVEGSSMKIVDYPVYSARRYQPNYIKYAVLGFVFGALVIAVNVIIRYFKDDSIKDENELEQRFSLPVLGIIPDINSLDKKSGSYYYKNYGYAYAKSHTGKEENS